MKQIALSISMIVAVLFAMLSIHSCTGLPSAYYDPQPFVFLPGECLTTTELHCSYAGPRGEHYDTGQSYIFYFYSDMGTEGDKLEKFSRGATWRIVPSDSVFQQFGSNASAVKEEYDRIWYSIPYPETTIYLNGEPTLIADRDFGGLPAGSNLVVLLDRVSFGDSCVPMPDGVLPEPKGRCAFHPSSYGFTYRIDNTDYRYERVDGEPVNFVLTVPVRVVYYLTWLNDKLTDENAPMTWKDVVLSHSFTSKTGWRLKE